MNPRLAKSLVIAKEFDCVYEMIVIAAMLDVEERLWRKGYKNRNNGNVGKENMVKEKGNSFVIQVVIMLLC